MGTERCPWSQSEKWQFLPSSASGGAGPAFWKDSGKYWNLQTGFQRLQERQADVYCVRQKSIMEILTLLNGVWKSKILAKEES